VKIELATLGTRGDIQPFVCLGRALADRGHEVELCAPRNGEQMAQAAGLPFRAMPCDVQTMLQAEQAERMLASGRVTAFLRWYYKEQDAYVDELRKVVREATESADLIVCGVFMDAACRAIGQVRDIPVRTVHLFPHAASRTYTSAVLPQRNLGPLARSRVVHELPFWFSWRLARKDLAVLHREVGAPPPTWRFWMDGYNGAAPSLQGYSQTLFPAPSDWPANLHPVGFLRPWPELRAQLGDVGIPPALESWLEAGPPPVFFGFGSMPVLDRRAMLRTIRTTLSDLGVRGILAAGWSELDSAGDESLFVVGEVDHQSLLPRCAAAVHHGGAGTTAASAAAGIPTLVCSVLADQPFWGERCRKLGIGGTFPFTKLDARRLTDGLRAVLNPRVAARAEEVARRMGEEDGVSATVEYLERGQGLAPVGPVSA
jgi:sterol 3beta-glucosyltransferase